MDESEAWANVSAIASQALDFWNSFLGLQSSDQVITPDQVSRLFCIIRAVSWVESAHGTGAGASASVDPMQCGNPADSWWIELTDCSGGQDRFVGGPGKPNFNACELPGAAAATGNLPDQANVNAMADPTQGHSDPSFNMTMSYFWGTPFLIFKINSQAGDPTYQCGDLNTDRLVAGAVAYNGGGDPDYEAKIRLAITTSGCLP